MPNVTDLVNTISKAISTACCQNYPKKRLEFLICSQQQFKLSKLACLSDYSSMSETAKTAVIRLRLMKFYNPEANKNVCDVRGMTDYDNLNLVL